jgi:hypothetical protein
MWETPGRQARRRTAAHGLGRAVCCPARASGGAGRGRAGTSGAALRADAGRAGDGAGGVWLRTLARGSGSVLALGIGRCRSMGARRVQQLRRERESRSWAAQEERVRGSRAHERRPQLSWCERLRHELMRRDASELASSEYGSSSGLVSAAQELAC